MAKLKLFSFYTPSHVIIKDVFLSSLQDDYEVEIFCPDNISTQKVKAEDAKHIGGGTNIWVYKTQKVIEVIRNNIGQVVIFADIDIKFFKKTEPVILECLGDFDILFQDDQFGGHIVNIGFLVIRCNERTAAFFEEVLNIVTRENIWDQKVVWMLLEGSRDREDGKGFVSRGGLCWNHLPLEVLPWHMVSSEFSLSAWSRFARIMSLDFRKIVLCHGTEWNALSIPERKIEIYGMCEFAMKWQIFWKCGHVLRFIRFYVPKAVMNRLRKLKSLLSKQHLDKKQAASSG